MNPVVWMALALGLLSAAACQVKGWAPDHSTGAQSDAGSIPGQPTLPLCDFYSVRPVGPSPVGDDPEPPSCFVGEDGSLTMVYQASSCPEVRPFRGCEIAKQQNVSAFDSGDGVWQAEICVDGPLTDTINVWYETSGAVRKYMNLVSPGAAGGCRIIFISPLDACFSSDSCGPGCPTGDGGASGPDGACPAFTDTKLVLMSEWCVCPTAGCPPPSTVTVKLLSLSYFSDGCFCETNADCTEPRPICRKDAWPDEARCQNSPGGCPGVCLP